MLEQQSVIGIDLGGTAIKLGQFLADGTCLRSLTVPTPQPATPEAVLAQMLEALQQIDPQKQAGAIGVGVPGPVDASGRVVRLAINLQNWQNVPLAEYLEAKTGCFAVLANDANCAGLGEAWLGAGRQFDYLLLLTLGTGVGGAVILNKQLFVGPTGAAAELGLIALYPDGHYCNSGNQGSLEQYASIQAIRRRTGLDPREVAQLAQQGNPQSLAFWQDYGRDLGVGLSTLIYIFTPQAILLGGGISASIDFFLPAVQAEIERRVLPSSREGLKILPASLGSQAGVYGAAKLALQHMEKRV